MDEVNATRVEKSERLLIETSNNLIIQDSACSVDDISHTNIQNLESE